ncbi:hypothetical protein C0W96_06580 [Photobacterium kishitanii]|uniref:hypothetical protein n=1 Tax=Photobacterium kishitanii TaxID=318456 RepID=UPI0005D39AD5|nr:hypothetical protein [Photobacterium kishitanii]KJG10176.1 hypothetical protein UB40_09015 [Photobacterium kishitanii]PSV06923.1 hypothetical protein C0W96_06580 [Photobacterium kishitanii]PSV78057.1 hypothetical protein C0W29_01655 [Photobacterium kishitanii]
MKVLERNHQKILETKKLLESIISDPEPFKEDEIIKKSLISQGAIAKYENRELGIFSCSVNTYKSVSNDLLLRGFTEIDKLRLHAQDAILGKKNKAKKPPKGRIAALEDELKELKKSAEIDKKTIELLILSHQEILASSKQIAFSNKSIEERCKLYNEMVERDEAKRNFFLYGVTSCQ